MPRDVLNIGQAAYPAGGFSVFHSALQESASDSPGSYLIRLREYHRTRHARRPKIPSLFGEDAVRFRRNIL